jgi:hypothetical protein
MDVYLADVENQGNKRLSERQTQNKNEASIADRTLAIGRFHSMAAIA